jgi:hypothetical protein
MRSRVCAVAAVLCALVLGACGDTLQVRPIAHNTLEGLLAAPYPVYWVGGSFRRLAVTEATHDPSGAFSIQYGNCLVGGQGVCVPPLRIVTSPDNSFLPGGRAHSRSAQVRGAAASLVQGGRTIVLATANVVVDIYAHDARTAHAAARSMVPINEPASPGDPLPAAQPDSGYAAKPLPSQLPQSRRPPAE